MRVIRARWSAPAAGAALAVFLWVWQYRATSGTELGDLPVYAHTYRLMALGQVPFVDFRLEYPPLAAGLFWLAGVLPGSYALGFSLLMLAGLLATLAGVVACVRALGLGDPAVWCASALVGLSPWLMGPIVQTRYDLAVAALVAWSVWAALTGRWTLAWLLGGVAVLVKLVPLAFAPALLAAQGRAMPWRAVLRTLLPGAVLVVAGIVPFAAVSPGGAWQMVAYHLDRPLQIESTGAAVLLALHHLAGTGAQHVVSYGSDNLVGDTAARMATLGTLVGLLALAALVVRVARDARPDPRARARLLAGALAATLAVLIATGKVLSPQYLLWLLPLVPLAGPRRGPLACGLLAVAMVLSRMVFPTRYRELTEELAATPVALLVARDALLVVLVVVLWPRVARRNTYTPSAANTLRMSGRADS